MKTKAVGLAVAVCVLMLFGATAAQAAMRFCVSITGVKQGQFKGQNTSPICPNRIEGVTFDYDVVAPSSFTSGAGAVVGKPVHKPVRIKTEWGASSLQLFQAITQGEVLTAVVVDFFSLDPTGKGVLDHTIKLTNALVSSIAYSSDSPMVSSIPSVPAMETVQFVFNQIELIDHKSKTVMMHKLN